jgi:chromosome segregation ATPase
VEGLQDPTNVARARNPDASPEMIERLKQIEKLKGDLAQLQTKFTSKHPDVVRLQDRSPISSSSRSRTKRRCTRSVRPPQAARRHRRLAADDAKAPRRKTIESIDGEIAKLREEEQAIRATIVSFEQRLEGAPEREQEFPSSHATVRPPRISTTRC